MTTKSRATSSGFSLIELLVGMAAGLVVVSAVASFTVASLQSNTQTVQATRLTQEMRLAMSVMMREIRRSGYDHLAETNIGGLAASTRYAGVTVSGDQSCIVVSYENVQDATVNAGASPAAGEWKGFRRVDVGGVGVVQANFTSNPPNCANNTNWVALTNPQLVNVSALTFASTGPAAVTTGLPASIASVTVREFTITLTANLVADAAIARTVVERARVRTDQVAFVPPPTP